MFSKQLSEPGHIYSKQTKIQIERQARSGSFLLKKCRKPRNHKLPSKDRHKWWPNFSITELIQFFTNEEYIPQVCQFIHPLVLVRSISEESQTILFLSESFSRKQEYGLTILVSNDEKVNAFLKSILSQIKDW